MYSGITGLRNFQTKLDVIGNNIANVNTYGFKKGRTVFKDLVSQTVAGASAPTGTQGGVNPRQVGLGSQIAAIDTLHGQGSSQFTGNTLDLSITGDGFFIVEDGGERVYTRAGNFYMDRNGDLVDADGRYVQGATGIINIPTTASSMSVGQDGTVYYVDLPPGAAAAIATAEGIFATAKTTYEAAKTAYEAAKSVYDAIPTPPGPDATQEATWTTAQGTWTTAQADYKTAQDDLAQAKEDNAAELMEAGQIQMAKFANPGGLEKIGGNLFRASANSGPAETGFATQQGFGSMESGFLEMSNVDLAEEFTEMIVAQRGFQANTRIITTSDEILQELVNLKR